MQSSKPAHRTVCYLPDSAPGIPCGSKPDMLLYGNDMDGTTTLLEAGLGWIVKFDKGDFIGREALQKQKQEGVKRRLVGFEMLGRDIARDHYPCSFDGREVGPRHQRLPFHNVEEEHRPRVSALGARGNRNDFSRQRRGASCGGASRTNAIL